MSKHTPAPWVASQGTHGEWGIDSASGWGIATAAGSAGPGPGDDESEANARLIAAAPELMEALSESVKQLDTIIADGTPTDWQAWRDSLAEAIAKAGGQP